MSLIKKPSEIEPKAAISVLIYGQPGMGKSTLGCSALRPLLFDYDGGVQRINGAHQVDTVQVRSWEDTNAALSEVIAMEKEAGHSLYDTFVFDTAGKMLDYMAEYITRTDPKMAMKDGSLSLKGFGVRKKMFVDFIKSITISGKSLVFIAHEREEKQNEVTVKRPEIGGSSAADLLKELDLVGYLSASGKLRTISFNPCEAFYAKNACNLPEFEKLAVTVDENGNAVGSNNYLTTVLSRYVAYQEEQRKLKASHAALVGKYADMLSKAKSAEDFNKALAEVAKEAHIFNSKVVIGQSFNTKAKELKLTFDKEKNAYVGK